MQFKMEYQTLAGTIEAMKSTNEVPIPHSSFSSTTSTDVEVNSQMDNNVSITSINNIKNSNHDDNNNNYINNVNNLYKKSDLSHSIIHYNRF